MDEAARLELILFAICMRTSTTHLALNTHFTTLVSSAVKRAGGASFTALASELRTRSQQERKNVFWSVALNDAIDRETVEVFRSKDMLARKEPDA